MGDRCFNTWVTLHFGPAKREGSSASPVPVRSEISVDSRETETGSPARGDIGMIKLRCAIVSTGTENQPVKLASFMNPMSVCNVSNFDNHS